MMQNGASKDAVDFTNRLGNFGQDGEGYADQFKAFGPVDLIRLYRPYYGMDGEVTYLLVNGTPSIVDATDWNRIKQINLRSNPTFRRISASYPKVEVWIDPAFVGERRTPAGQEFILQYPLLDGCHACDLLGYVQYAFTFGKDGLFVGARVYRVSIGQPPHSGK